MESAKPISTSLASHFKLSKEQGVATQEEREFMAKVLYAFVIRNLMYSMVCTRPVIAQAVVVVSGFMQNPGKEQWEAVKWILSYLKVTKDMALCYVGSKNYLHGYVNSDLAGDIDKRNNTTGYVFTMGSVAVSWVSHLQKVMTISTTEAKYVDVTEAWKEFIWVKGLMKELGKEQEDCILFSNNRSASHLAKN